MTSEDRKQGTAWRIPVTRLRTHNAIVDHLGLGPGDVLADLGCGNGFTLATAATRVTGLSLIGIDVDDTSLEAAGSWLEEIGAHHALFRADLDDPLPLPDNSVSHVVSHDVLECLADPGQLLVEAARVLRPGGTAVWSHVDYEGVLVSGADRALTRRVLRAYVDAPDPTRGHSDAQMGRRLAALVARSPLVRTDVDAHVLIATDLAGPGGHRIDDIASTVRRKAPGAELGPDDVDRWQSELRVADERGEFFYSQTAFIVTSVSRAPGVTPSCS